MNARGRYLGTASGAHAGGLAGTTGPLTRRAQERRTRRRNDCPLRPPNSTPGVCGGACSADVIRELARRNGRMQHYLTVRMGSEARFACPRVGQQAACCGRAESIVDREALGRLFVTPAWWNEVKIRRRSKRRYEGPAPVGIVMRRLESSTEVIFSLRTAARGQVFRADVGQ